MKSKIQFNQVLRKRFYYEGQYLLVLKRVNSVSLKVFKPLFFFSKIRNICIYTGRSRFVFKFFRFSRLVLNKSFYAGFSTMFLKKYSW